MTTRRDRIVPLQRVAAAVHVGRSSTAAAAYRAGQDRARHALDDARDATLLADLLRAVVEDDTGRAAEALASIPPDEAAALASAAEGLARLAWTAARRSRS